MSTITRDLLLHALDTGLALLTQDGGLTPVNPAFAQLLRYSTEPAHVNDLADVMALTSDTSTEWRTFLLALDEQTLTIDLSHGQSLQWRKKQVQHPQHGACWALMVVDVTSSQLRIAQLTADCERDVLTGIANRRKFELEFLRAIELTRRTGQQGALILFDLDNFKSINDRFGHWHGDWVLEQVGPAVSPLIRRYELLARVGGDEFGILITHAGAQAVERLRQQLPLVLERINGAAHGETEPVRASIGYALFPEGNHTTRDIYELADRSLYQHKDLRSQRAGERAS